MTRLYLKQGTVIRKQALGPGAEDQAQRELSVLSRLGARANWLRLELSMIRQ